MQRKHIQKTSPIWIIDDDPRFSRQLKRFLQDHYFENIFIFETCELALESISGMAERPELVILDIQFPDYKMSGLEFLRALGPLSQKIKILVMTSYLEDVYSRFSLSHGAVGFINKTQSPTEMLHAISLAIE
jgi:DNA-binding NarL/FixJ family response regulator